MPVNPIEEVILVNEKDEVIGTMEKVEAHRRGALHRAFSVILFRPDGRMLIQKRADCKYHSPGLWSNACCSHPRPGEALEKAVHRRLQEELGLQATLRYLYTFIYEVDFGNGLHEHELDHVFVGTTELIPRLNPVEIEDYTFVAPVELQKDMLQFPEKYSYWFRLIIEKLTTYDNFGVDS